MTPTQTLVAALAVLTAVLALYLAGRAALAAIAKIAARPEPRVWIAGGWRRASPFARHFALRFPKTSSAIAARLDIHRFKGLPLTLMTIAALYLVGLFGGLVEDLLSSDGLVSLDAGINSFFGPWRTPIPVQAFLWITALGSSPAVVAVAVASSGLLVSSRRRELVVPLWTTLIGAEATTWAGKFLIDRQRPTFIEAASALSPSFPSGHSTAAMAVYGFLAYLVARDLPTARQRFEVVFWTSILIVLIGFSRIFLSVHFTSDVLSGFIVGAFWLLVGFAIAENRRQGPPLLTQPVVAEPAGPLPKGSPISPSQARQPAI